MGRPDHRRSGHDHLWPCAYRRALSEDEVHRRAAAAMLGRDSEAPAAGHTRGRADGRSPGRASRPARPLSPPNRYPHPSAGPYPGRPGGPPARRTRQDAMILGVIAAAAGAATVLAAGWMYAPVAAWGAVCVAYLVRVWRGIGRLTGPQTARQATRDDPGRTAMDVMLVAVAVASLIDVVGLLAASRNLDPTARTLHALGAVLSVGLSWAVLHTLFTLRYARLYHRSGHGLDFNAAVTPNYRDFAYVAFTIGMTYQLSDTAASSGAFRGEILRHAMLSYLFGTLVLAAVVNLLVGLFP